MATLEQEAFADAPAQAGPVMVGVAGPAGQRRETVALRLILALPHLIILAFLGAGAAVAAVIGWAGAVATGQLPEFAADYLCGYTRWTCRVAAYLMLLTDVYPPFSRDEEPGYPAGADVSPGRLNRRTAAFRIVLGIPGTAAAAILASGSVTVVLLAAWVITLVTGRLPASLHHGFAAVLRYLFRCHGYACLLTDVYPLGAFQGVSRGARRVVTLIMVLGMLTVAAAGAFGGIWARAAIARHRTISRFDAQVTAHNAAVAGHDKALSKAQQALAQTSTAGMGMAQAQDALNRALDATNKRMNSCSSARCFDSLNVTNARGAAAFGRTMAAISMPAGASALARRLASETVSYQKSWTYMSLATSLADVEKRARTSEGTESRFYAADNALALWLKDQADDFQRQEAGLDQDAALLNRSGAALRQRGATLGVQPGVRAARPSRQRITGTA